MTISAVRNNVPATRSRSTGNSSGYSSRTTAALALVAAIVLADVMSFGRVVECRSFQDTHLQRSQRQINNFDKDYLSDGAPIDDEEEVVDESPPSGTAKPAILTTNLVLEVDEGTTVNLPCKVTEGSLDTVVLIWINGTKTIMTDSELTTTDTRIKAGPESSGPGPSEHTLVIEQVTKWDSGTYTCKITSTPPVLITHTLRVKQPAKIIEVFSKSTGGSGVLSESGNMKKVVVKQGEPVQLLCSTEGYPKPTVQWTKKAKYQQPSQSSLPTTVVVSNTNEMRIESVEAIRDSGFYECVADNNAGDLSASSSSPTTVHMGLELSIEHDPDVIVNKKTVHSGDMFSAQLLCIVYSNPKPKVTWEKEITSKMENSWQSLTTESKNTRYQSSKFMTNSNEPFSGNMYQFVIKPVKGAEDFGRYRCRAENKHGFNYSEPITLTGLPAKPMIVSSVNIKTNPITNIQSAEIKWAVDSYEPLVQYQLQYKRQQDDEKMWLDVKPDPIVVEAKSDDERRFNVAYVFGDTQQQPNSNVESSVPENLDPATVYVARLRAKNLHGWSEWSDETVFSSGSNESNNISDDKDQVSKASVGGSTGAASCLQSSAPVIVLATALVAALVSAH